MVKEALIEYLRNNLRVDVTTDTSYEGDGRYLTVGVKISLEGICLACESSCVNIS